MCIRDSYSTLVDERANQCPVTPGLNRVRSSSLEYVEPIAHPVVGVYPYTGKAYMPALGYNTVSGDVDCDAVYFDPGMFDGIDAVMHPREINGSPVAPDKSRVFFSPNSAFTDLSGTVLRPSPLRSPCLLYTSPSPRDRTRSRMPSSA